MNDNMTFKQDKDKLVKAVLALKNEAECNAFFEDILTIQELHAIAQRLKVAGMLKEGMTCQHIADETGASTATISRVNKCLHYGPGGYGTVLERLGNEE
ncbi:MAG: YerC/YecD family TrpR-related protein [Eubacteriales bacterium]